MPAPVPPTTLPLSVAIVCHNSEQTIGRVLDSVRGMAAEIIALDSGSTDSTIDLLTRAGATVIHQPWLGYVRQKQAALDRCAQPWILHLDSDESLDPDLRRSIEIAVRPGDPTIDGYELNRKVWYAGRFLNYAWQPELRLRLVRRGRARWGGYDPHDAMELIPDPGAPGRRIARLSGDIRHECIASISDFLARQARHADTAAAALRARGRRGSIPRLVFSPLGEFAKQIIVRRAFLDGWRGWTAASASAAATLMKHAALIEASRTPGSAHRDKDASP